MGLFSAFLDDKSVEIYGVEPAGKGLDTDMNAATMHRGKKGILHGFKCYFIQDENGEALPVYSIASGLDYPGVGPQHCYLHDINRVTYESATDREAVEAFYALSRMEGIIPALESSHAVAYAVKLAKKMGKGFLFRRVGIEKIGDIAGELIRNDVVENTAGVLVAEQRAGLFEEGPVFTEKFFVKKLAAADGNIRRKQRVLCGKRADVLYDAALRGAKNEQNHKIRIFFLDFFKREYALPVKAMSSDKSVGGEKI